MTNEQSGANETRASARNGYPNGATVNDGHDNLRHTDLAVNGHLNCRDGPGSAIHSTGDNAPSNGYTREEEDEPYDLICVGFGPASLAIGIALYDRGIPTRVLFLERQSQFAWHSGMLLPGARMQISFMKDLATFRNPKSEFTFINYLHQKNRLASFTNMGTFLPLREEYNDYMSWCASHFDDVVKYSQEVLSVTPVDPTTTPVRIWEVISRSARTGEVVPTRTKNVVIAVGGQPSFPPAVARDLPDPRIFHSSRYSDSVPNLLDDPMAPYNIAVVGAGQSSAEIFSDLQSRYPNSKTALFIRQHALKPSDDSPFVNEIFDPDRVDTLYSLSPPAREASILEDRATNYSVVRTNLLEDLYYKMYLQRFRNPNEIEWRHRIHPLREVFGTERNAEGKIRLKMKDTHTGETLDSVQTFDAVIFGTGYSRTMHHTMLKPAKFLMKDEYCNVGRDYKVIFQEGAVAESAGIYLQGCCEKTHGLSDSLLSILAVRGGELVDSVFGSIQKSNSNGFLAAQPRR